MTAIAKLKNVKPRDLRRDRGRAVRGIRSDIDDVKLAGKKWRAMVTDAIVDTAPITRTMEGASTLTLPVFDPDNAMVQSPLFEKQFDVELDGLVFRFVGFEDEGEVTQVLFESRDVNRLRQQYGHIRALRDKVTRAEFSLMLIRELRKPRVPFFCPELHTVQPIRNSRDARNDAKGKDDRREPGLDADAPITVKGENASLAQVRVIKRVLDVGVSLGANRRVLISSVMTITVESTATNLGHGDLDSLGAFQQRTGWPGNPRDIENAARNYFERAPTYPGGAIAYEKAHRGASLASICQAIQRSAYPGEYAKWEKEASRTVNEYLGGGSGALSIEKEIPYTFERRVRENSWDCMGRLAEEVRWRRFEANGLVYMVNEPYLLQSRIRLRVGDDAPGIDSIQVKFDTGKPVQEVRIAGRARAWSAPPGTVAFLRGHGPADGRYLVKEINGNLFTDTFDATLVRPTEPLKEPAAETKSVSIPGKSGAAGGAAGRIKEVGIPNTKLGAPSYGGTHAIFNQYVNPFLEEYGLKPGSQKEQRSNASSDHDLDNLDAYAIDYPTNNGERAARALAVSMGFSAWQPDSYATFNVTIDKHVYRVQILWGSGIDHGDHVHVGIKLVSR